MFKKPGNMDNAPHPRESSIVLVTNITPLRWIGGGAPPGWVATPVRTSTKMNLSSAPTKSFSVEQATEKLLTD